MIYAAIFYALVTGTAIIIADQSTLRCLPWRARLLNVAIAYGLGWFAVPARIIAKAIE